jgi:hypothetical protein
MPYVEKESLIVAFCGTWRSKGRRVWVQKLNDEASSCFLSDFPHDLIEWDGTERKRFGRVI